VNQIYKQKAVYIGFGEKLEFISIDLNQEILRNNAGIPKPGKGAGLKTNLFEKRFESNIGNSENFHASES